MNEVPSTYQFFAMGCTWEVKIWDDISSTRIHQSFSEIEKDAQKFESFYSRFKDDSLLKKIEGEVGVHEVPSDLVEMLQLYQKLYTTTGGAFSPLVGGLLSDIGYDEKYSLSPQEKIRDVPPLSDIVSLLDDHTIQIHQKASFDLGGIGKGFFVDKAKEYLRTQGVKKFLINGSGDIYYESADEYSLSAGLEHPQDPTQVIGEIKIKNQALCASSSNRRRWNGHHHIIDATSKIHPEEVIATWVLAAKTVEADTLATCLFLTDVQKLQKDFEFEYCILTKDLEAITSPGFHAELYS